MKKKTIIITSLIIVFVLITTGGAYWAYKKYTTPQASSEIKTQQAQTSQADTSVVATTKRAGTYEQYDPAKLALAQDGKVVLFFNSKYSKTSKQLDAAFKDKSTKFPSNITILSIDYDKNYALRQQYGVPFEGTFVQVDANGNMINRWSGSEDPAEIFALAK